MLLSVWKLGCYAWLFIVSLMHVFVVVALDEGRYESGEDVTLSLSL